MSANTDAFWAGYYEWCMERYEDNITPEPLRKGIEAAQKIGRGIGSIFKKDDQE